VWHGRPFTGGLAAGKSTVRRWLGEAGFLAVDADELVAQLYEPGGRGSEVISDLLGMEYLDAEGAVDRPKVASRVFAEPALRSALEEAIHPLVRQTFAELASTTDAQATVLEATLLVEAGYGPDFDLIATVETSREVQRQRAIDRGLSPEQADARLDAQGDGADRRAGANYTIENDGTLEDLRSATDELIGRIREMSEQTAPPPGEEE